MKVNAGLKSKEEAALRMMDGEVFYYKGVTVDYDSYRGFRFGPDPLENVWNYYKEYTRDREWWEDIPECGVVCSVYNTTVVAPLLRLITRKERGHYVDDAGGRWKRAIPVSLDDFKFKEDLEGEGL